MSALFANPGYLLAGLLAALIPLVIHLLTRDRVKKVAFPTLRFFAMNSRVVIARKRFREALLIALRMLACFLLALAFAIPGRQQTGQPAAGVNAVAVARVIVVDVSASMGRPGAARQKALQEALASVQGGDRTAVVAFDQSARVLTTDFVVGADAAAQAVQKAVAGEGGTDLLAGVRVAGRMLEGVAAERKEVVLVSDLQRCGWENYQGDWRLPAGVKLRVLPVRPEAGASAGKVAFAAAEIPQTILRDRQSHVLAVRLHNFGGEALKDLPVTLRLAGKDVETQTVNLPAGTSAPVRFRKVFDKDGDNPGEIVFRADAGWPGENAYYFNVQIVPQVKVLILNGRPDVRPLNDAAFFLKLALAPGQDAPFEVKVVNAASASAAEIDAATVVVLAEVNAVAAPAREALRGLLNRGGGLFFLPGDGVQPEAFSASFEGLAPCRLRRVLTPPAAMTIAKVELEHPAFSVFAPARSGNFGALQFSRYWEVSDSQLAKVLVRFADGRPFVLEKDLGKGISVLAASPVNLGWNTLPKHVLLVPYLHQLVRYLAVRTEQRTAYLVGETLPVLPGASVVSVGGGAWGEGTVAQKSGLFRIAAADAGHVVAVNRFFAEANPATVEAEEIVTALQISDEELRKEQAKTAPQNSATNSRIWWYVLLLLCGWLAVEHLVASRTTRH